LFLPGFGRAAKVRYSSREVVDLVKDPACAKDL
jgi:hypothetical protein